MTGYQGPRQRRVALSPSELKVLELVWEGCANKQIGTQLGISEQTVKNHMSSILSRLHVNDRTAACRFAIEKGFLPCPHGVTSLPVPIEDLRDVLDDLTDAVAAVRVAIKPPDTDR